MATVAADEGLQLCLQTKSWVMDGPGSAATAALCHLAIAGTLNLICSVLRLHLPVAHETSGEGYGALRQKMTRKGRCC